MGQSFSFLAAMSLYERTDIFVRDCLHPLYEAQIFDKVNKLFGIYWPEHKRKP